jgi:hypothetical protein
MGNASNCAGSHLVFCLILKIVLPCSIEGSKVQEGTGIGCVKTDCLQRFGVVVGDEDRSGSFWFGGDLSSDLFLARG